MGLFNKKKPVPEAPPLPTLDGIIKDIEVQELGVYLWRDDAYAAYGVGFDIHYEVWTILSGEAENKLIWPGRSALGCGTEVSISYMPSGGYVKNSTLKDMMVSESLYVQIGSIPGIFGVIDQINAYSTPKET